MRHPLRWILLLASSAAFGVVPPVDAEPSRFAGFAWGTLLAEIAPALKTQCDSSTSYLSITGRQALVCSSYHAMANLGLDHVDLRLEFTKDGLQGYTVAVPRADEAKLRAMAPQILQAAPSRAGTQPSATASPIFDKCLPGFFCLTVRTY